MIEGLCRYIFIHIFAITCVIYIVRLREDIDTLKGELRNQIDLMNMKFIGHWDRDKLKIFNSV
jgi:hypothetical protein